MASMGKNQNKHNDPGIHSINTKLNQKRVQLFI